MASTSVDRQSSGARSAPLTFISAASREGLPLKLILCLALAVVTFVCYWPVRENGFIRLDDQEYLTQNPNVNAGLTWSGVAWAFATGHACNWHPLTWLSHMLDCQLFGLNPAGHHLSNLLFHVANSVLLFVLLQRMTRSVWRSGLVAALFALHPTHVESVAWAAERKDVLSTLFFLLTLLTYIRYVRLSSWAHADAPTSIGGAAKHSGDPAFSFDRFCLYRPWLFYSLALVLFALGLMSKPMVVTLPFILLLLDYWPLERWDMSNFRDQVPKLVRLVGEKIPFFLLALAGSVITFLVQDAGGATYSMDRIPLSMRLANAATAYVRYLGKLFWPSDLSVFYPYREHWPVTFIVGSILLLILVSAVCLVWGRRERYLLPGWLWFLGTLVPTIGIVQVGSQSMADRYLYLPSIGLFVLVAWGLATLVKNRVIAARLVCLATPAAVAVLFFCSTAQVKCWQSDEKLFRHALEVTQDNYLAYVHLADASDSAGRRNEALNFCLEALRVRPRFAEGHYNAGTYLLELGRMDVAITHLREAVAIDPKFAPAHANLGKALLTRGEVADAITQFSEATELEPESAEAHYRLGTALLAASKPSQAITELSRSLALNPADPEAHMNLGIAIASQGKTAEATVHFSNAVHRAPHHPRARLNLGLALLNQGRPTEAVTQFEVALRLSPRDVNAHYQIALALVQSGRRADAVAHCREALRLAPDFSPAAAELARLEAPALAQAPCPSAEAAVTPLASGQGTN